MLYVYWQFPFDSTVTSLLITCTFMIHFELEDRQSLLPFNGHVPYSILLSWFLIVSNPFRYRAIFYPLWSSCISVHINRSRIAFDSITVCQCSVLIASFASDIMFVLWVDIVDLYISIYTLNSPVSVHSLMIANVMPIFVVFRITKAFRWAQASTTIFYSNIFYTTPFL